MKALGGLYTLSKIFILKIFKFIFLLRTLEQDEHKLFQLYYLVIFQPMNKQHEMTQLFQL